MKMDPTINYITIKSAFDKNSARYDGIEILNSGYSYNDFEYKIKLTKRKIDKQFDNLYGNIDQKIIDQKDKYFTNPRFREARDNTNPFEGIGKSTFYDRAAVKLANIDAVFYLTSQEYVEDNEHKELSSSFGGQLAPQLMGEFHYCDIAGAPGGWTEYVQFRRPGSIGYGISLNDPTILWNENIINMDKFSYTYGDDKTGNLYTNSESFIQYAKNHQIDLYDLVMSDGGFDVGEDKEMQETLTSRLLLCECYIGAALVKNRRHFVCKLFNTNSQFLVDLIFLMSILFDTVYVFKPISSRPLNAERYLICRNLIDDNRSEVVNILKQLYDGYTDDDYYYSIFESLPKDYLNWIKYHNKLNMDRQLEYTEKIINYLNKIPVDLPVYNLYKALVMWNIPDNVDRKINRETRVNRIKQSAYIPRTSKKYFNEINIEGEMVVSVGSKKNPSVVKKTCSIR